jgi:hypothetical protein
MIGCVWGLGVGVGPVRGKYARLFAMTKTTLLNIDPDNWSVTNTWPYPTDVVDFSPNVSSPDEFTLTVKDGKKNKCVCEKGRAGRGGGAEEG